MDQPDTGQGTQAPTRVRGLVLPTLLMHLLASGRWRHPGDDALRKIMPWFEDPLDFLTDVDQIRRESASLDHLTEDEDTARVFRLARGNTAAGPVELPWLDVDLALLIAVNRFAGDDVVVALDYRTSSHDPRVVASDIWTDPSQYSWRTIAPTFTTLTATLGLTSPRPYGYVGPADIYNAPGKSLINLTAAQAVLRVNGAERLNRRPPALHGRVDRDEPLSVRLYSYPSGEDSGPPIQGRHCRHPR